MEKSVAQWQVSGAWSSESSTIDRKPEQEGEGNREKKPRKLLQILKTGSHRVVERHTAAHRNSDETEMETQKCL